MKTIDVYGVKATYRNYEDYEDFYTYDKMLSIHQTFEDAKETIFGDVTIETLEGAGFCIHECFTEMANQIILGFVNKNQRNRIIIVKDDGPDSSDINNVRRTITFNPDGCHWHKFDISLTIEKLPMTIVNVDAFMEELK